jgi:uncharacterized protein (TIRG00374 family)
MADQDSPAAPSSPLRRTLTIAVKVVVSVGLLAFLATRMDLAKLRIDVAHASIGWLAVGLGLYFLILLISTWRWQLLLRAQHIDQPSSRLLRSYLVATFFNNFLPSNIGGDVIRVTDTAPAAGSKTLATTIVLMDRGLGLLALLLVGAVGATLATSPGPGGSLAMLLWCVFLGGSLAAIPMVLVPDRIGQLLSPLRVFHQEWVDERIGRFTVALGKFGRAPGAMLACFAGAVLVQAILVCFYVSVARSMNIPVTALQLAVIVPVSFVIQLLPVSVNGFGVREATFSLYFSRLGLPLESGVAVSLVAAGLIILFSLSGAAAYISRSHHRS